MSELKLIYDEDDNFVSLETVDGYLQYFRGYRIQLSGTVEGVGDRGSSQAVIHHHFSNIEVDCSDEMQTKFIHLVGLAHAAEAMRGNIQVIKQVKNDVDKFNQFMEHLLSHDFDQPTKYQFELENVLSHLKAVTLGNLKDLNDLKILEGIREGDVSIASGYIGSEAFVVDARTLVGYSLDFSEFATKLDDGSLVLTGAYVEFALDTLHNIVSFVNEYPKLYKPNFYVNKTREDSFSASNLFT